jgi:hypothetical protein
LLLLLLLLLLSLEFKLLLLLLLERRLLLLSLEFKLLLLLLVFGLPYRHRIIYQHISTVCRGDNARVRNLVDRTVVTETSGHTQISSHLVVDTKQLLILLIRIDMRGY